MAKISAIYFLSILSSILCHLSYAQDDFTWEAHFENTTCSIYMGDLKNISLTIANLNKADLIESNATIRVVSDSNILRVTQIIPLNEIDGDKWNGFFRINAIFIGHANVLVKVVRENKQVQRSTQQIRIDIRHKSILGTVFMKYFNICVLVFYFVMYINFGVVLELSKVKTVVRKPLRPCVAFICNFIFSPLAGYLLGMLLFPDSDDLRYGIFVCALSLLGGGLIIWNAILGVNIDVSLTQSILNTLFACGVVIPLWVFTFGEIVFDREYLAASYSSFVWNIIYLIIPLCIGVLIQYFCPRSTKFAMRSMTLIIDFYVISYIVLMIVEYWNMFTSEIFMFTWKYFLGGFFLPVIAYSFGWIVALIIRDEYKDQLELATAALTKNITIVNSIMHITVYFPHTESHLFLSSLVIIMIPIPIIVQQLIHLVVRRLTNKHSPQPIPQNEPESIPPK
ncbi:ileal sodium/bile acid cotransporter-like [Sitodiplosis mosellana]|uniref:ileal sodium/bile acid cotransporter-like n=1 Tax=Sitodiplosis mosellana TaxID=263140 RepID=UPI0024447AA3|nr:ileal sodium/bile acid cotransporter-like [Sitodiplosis mosellana]